MLSFARAVSRVAAVVLVWLIALAATAGTAAARPLGGAVVTPDGALGRNVARLLNEVRSELRRRALHPSSALTRAALAHAASMGRDGFFSHASASGESEGRRLSAYYRGPVAEALFWRTGRVRARDVLEEWLGSSSHRRVLLGKRHRALGIGVVYVERAPGVFGGRDVTIVVADFGDPA